MTKGKAKGVARQFQERARDILLAANPGFAPYDGDGVDIVFRELGGNDHTIDVALKHPGGDVIVAECRYRGAPSQQGDIDRLFGVVTRLREALETHVIGVYVTKVNPQQGAVRVAENDLSPIIVAGAQVDRVTPESGFSITFHTWDAALNKRLLVYAMRVGAGAFQMKFHDAALIYTDRDGNQHQR